MGEFKWRTGARIVAVLDLIFSIIGLVIIVLVGMGLVLFFPMSTQPENVKGESVIKNGSNEAPIDGMDIESVQRGKFKGLLALYAVLAVLLGCQVRFTLRLEKATQIEADTIKALHWSRSWRNYNFVFLLLIILQIPLGLFWLNPSPVEHLVAAIYAILMRIAFLVVVQFFIRELKRNMQATQEDTDTATDYNRLV